MAWAGLFNEVVDIMKYAPSTNEYGEVTKTLTREYTTRAKVVHLSGSRTVRNDDSTPTRRHSSCASMRR